MVHRCSVLTETSEGSSTHLASFFPPGTGNPSGPSGPNGFVIELCLNTLRNISECLGNAILIAPVCAILGLAAESTAAPVRITLEKISHFESPLKEGGGDGNSHLLPGMPEDGPVIAITWARNYLNCTTAFYNLKLQEVARWRQPSGEKIMAVASGDLEGDGTVEIVMSSRMETPGVYVKRWNAREHRLEDAWSYLLEPTGHYLRGVNVGNFSTREGKEVVFGNSDGQLFLLDKQGELLASGALWKDKSIQRIDVADVDGDGFDEMILATGRTPGSVHLVSWDPTSHELKVHWSTDATALPRSGDNCYEARYHPRGHPDGGPAIAAASEQEGGEHQGSVLLLDLTCIIHKKGSFLRQVMVVYCG